MHAARGVAFGLLALVTGCRATTGGVPEEDCATFAELEVTNADGAAPVEVLAEVDAAIDQFEAWTGRDGVCVGEVRLVPEIVVSDGRTALGRYNEGLIEIVHEDGGANHGVVTRHELCHAVDHEAGWFSETRPDWFPSDLPHEDFAYACDEGPRPVSLTEAIEDACGIELLAARQGYINDEVYAAAEVASEPPAGTLPISLERRALTGLPEEGDIALPVAGGDGIYLPAWSSAGDEGSIVSILLVDPASATVVDAIEGPFLPLGERYTLLPSDGAPLLVYGEQGGAWTVDAAAGMLVEVPFLAFEGEMGGAVLDDAAWVMGTAAGEAARTFSRVDLATGVRTLLPWPEDIAFWSFSPDGGALSGRAWDVVTGHTWLTYTPDTGSWTRAVYPAGLQDATQATLPDGRVLATWMDPVAVATYSPTGLAVLDPATRVGVPVEG